MIESSLQPPEPTRGDRAVEIAGALVKGAIGSVPVVGSLLAEVHDLFFKQPIDKRREAWMADIADVVEEVHTKYAELTPESLASNEEFITVLHRASEVAIKTHEVSKRSLLRSALVNAASPTAPDLDLQAYFIRLVDELSVNQILILAFFDDPAGWFKRHQRPPPELYTGPRLLVFRAAYPELYQDEHFRDLQLEELERRALLNPIISGMVSLDDTLNPHILTPVTTRLAHDFLAYLRSSDGDIHLDAVPAKG